MPTRASAPLSAFQIITRAAPDQLADFALSTYRPHSARPLTEGWSNHIHHVQLADVGLSYGKIECGLDLNVGEQRSFYKVVVGLSGVSFLRHHHDEVALQPGEAVVKSATLPIRWRHGADAEALYLKIDRAALERQLTAISGRSLPTPIEFEPRVRAPALIRLLRFLAAEIDQAPVVVQQPILTSAYAEFAMKTLLTQQPNNYSSWLAIGCKEIAPRQLRIAEEILDAHADQPLTMAEVARAAGYSIRSLNRAFRRYRACTPYEFLQSARLKRANWILSTPGGARSVTDAALSCGFGNPGRFSVLYRERFGESPSMTFRRCSDAPHHAKEGEPATPEQETDRVG